MRPYPKNSPQAAARFIAMAVLSDGELGRVEWLRLDKIPELRELGIDAEAVEQVMRTFCADLLREAPVDAEGHCELRPAMLAGLLEDIDDPALRRTLCRIALDVIGADRRVRRGETALLLAALDAWDLHLADCFRPPFRAVPDPQPALIVSR